MIPQEKNGKSSTEPAETDVSNVEDNHLEAGNAKKTQSNMTQVSKSISICRNRAAKSIKFCSGTLSTKPATTSRVKQHCSTLSTSTPAVKLLFLLLLPTLTNLGQTSCFAFGSPLPSAPRRARATPRPGPKNAWVFRTTIRNPPAAPSRLSGRTNPIAKPGSWIVNFNPDDPASWGLHPPGPAPGPSPPWPSPPGPPWPSPPVQPPTNIHRPSQVDALACCTEMQRVRDSVAVLQRNIAELAILIAKSPNCNASVTNQSKHNSTAGMTGNNNSTHGWATTDSYHNKNRTWPTNNKNRSTSTNKTTTEPYPWWWETTGYNDYGWESTGYNDYGRETTGYNDYGRETTGYNDYGWESGSTDNYHHNNGNWSNNNNNHSNNNGLGWGPPAGQNTNNGFGSGTSDYNNNYGSETSGYHGYGWETTGYNDHGWESGSTDNYHYNSGTWSYNYHDQNNNNGWGWRTPGYNNNNGFGSGTGPPPSYRPGPQPPPEHTPWPGPAPGRQPPPGHSPWPSPAPGRLPAVGARPDPSNNYNGMGYFYYYNYYYNNLMPDHNGYYYNNEQGDNSHYNNEGTETEDYDSLTSKYDDVYFLN